MKIAISAEGNKIMAAEGAPGKALCPLCRHLDSHPDEPYERMADQLIEELTGKPQGRWNPPVPYKLGTLRELRFSWEAYWTVEEYVGWMSSRESIRQLLAGRHCEFLREFQDRLMAREPLGTFRERQIDYLFLSRGRGNW